MKKYDAVISGYICIDMIPVFKPGGSYNEISDLLKPGKLIEIENMNVLPGGLVHNTGLAMKKFNKNVFLNGLIGDDLIGKFAERYLDQYGLYDGISVTKEAGTAFSIVLAPPGIDRIFLESPGCNKIFNDSYINYGAIQQSRLFHFGYPPLLQKFYQNGGQQLFNMFSKVQQIGAITSLDLSLPDPDSESAKTDWPEIMRKTLPYVDIFVPSLEELLMIMLPDKYAALQTSQDNSNIFGKVPINQIRELGRQIIDSGVSILLIKAGKNGAYLITGDITALNEKDVACLDEKKWNYREIWSDAFYTDPFKLVNTLGSGDVAVAAFLSAILDGESPELALKYSMAAGRNSLYCKDIFNELNDWQTLKKEIDTEQNELKFF